MSIKMTRLSAKNPSLIEKSIEETASSPLYDYVNENGFKILNIIKHKNESKAFTKPREFELIDENGKEIEGECYELKKEPRFQHAFYQLLKPIYPLCPIYKFQDPEDSNKEIYISHNKPIETFPVVSKEELENIIFELSYYFCDSDRMQYWRHFNEHVRQDKPFNKKGNTWEKLSTSGTLDNLSDNDLQEFLKTHNVNIKLRADNKFHLSVFDFDRCLNALKQKISPSEKHFQDNFNRNIFHSMDNNKATKVINCMYQKIKKRGLINSAMTQDFHDFEIEIKNIITETLNESPESEGYADFIKNKLMKYIYFKTSEADQKQIELHFQNNLEFSTLTHEQTINMNKKNTMLLAPNKRIQPLFENKENITSLIESINDPEIIFYILSLIAVADKKLTYSNLVYKKIERIKASNKWFQT